MLQLRGALGWLVAGTHYIRFDKAWVFFREKIRKVFRFSQDPSRSEGNGDWESVKLQQGLRMGSLQSNTYYSYLKAAQ